MLHQFYILIIFSLIGSPLFSQIQFIENKGQWDQKVYYSARIPSGEMYIEKDRVTFNLIAPEDYGFDHHHKNESASHIEKGRRIENDLNMSNATTPTIKKIKAHAYSMRFFGADTDVKIVTAKPYGHSNNFFKGNDQSKWVYNAGAFNEIFYKGIYKGVDVKYFVEGEKLKYDIIIASGQDPSVVQLEYHDIDVLSIIENKLHIETSVNTVIEHIPEAYQIIKGKKKKIKCEYVLADNVVSFIFPEGYDSNADIIIDPVVDFATYTGSTADNWGFTATYDDDGNLYAGGISFNVGYPTTTGAYETNFSGKVDVTVSKFSADGKTLIYSTYLGGSDTEAPNSMIVNSKGELVIYGVTGSDNFPVTQDAFQKSYNGGWGLVFLTNDLVYLKGTDLFITVLGIDGDKLSGSTYYGGTQNEGVNDQFIFNYADDMRGEVILDEQDNIYVISNTYSIDLPVTPNAFKPMSESMDVCLFKMTPTCNNLLFGSYFGGFFDEAGFSLRIDKNKDLFIAGATLSDDLPATTDAYRSMNEDIDGFITKIDSNWNIIQTTYIGTSAKDLVYLIDIDQSDNVYATGISFGNMPVSPGAYNHAGSGQFIIKLNNDLTTREMSTVFGKGDGDPELSATAFMVDICGNIYYSGWGGGTNKAINTNYLITGLPVTSDALKPSTDGSDFYYMILAPNAGSLLYATYFGGNISEEHVDGGTSRFDRKGIIYQGICAGCGGNSDFPTTPGAYSNINGTVNSPEPNCNLGVAKISFELLNVIAMANVEPTVGCAPLNVQFNNTSEGTLFNWDLGNGENSTFKDPTAIYSNPGNYLVTLIASDTGDCFISDTFQISITVFDPPVAAFEQPSFIEAGQQIKFINQSKVNPNNTYHWDFGDGNISMDKNPDHTYATSGNYNVCLTIKDTISGCEDIACKTIVAGEFAIVDIPNAFTPNLDGHNDVLFIKGEGVDKVRLRVYNRWGELIFESTNFAYGWDGIYKGIPQDMDTYIYYLDATLVNGEEIAKKGNITLIR